MFPFPMLFYKRGLLFLLTLFTLPLVVASPPSIKVLFDTDIGNDIDDAVALAYLLTQPRCELLGIITVTGEPHKRAEMASALCRAAGRPDIPIYPGAAEALVTEQRQAYAPQHGVLGDQPRATEFPRGEAIEFMRRTIRANPGEVTLLAVGPLTNVALLFRTDPEIPSLLKEIVLMCGQFGAQPGEWGNKEWNVALDPEAAAIVFKSSPPKLRSYGLDVTLKVVMPAEEMAKCFSDAPQLRLVLVFAQVWFRKQEHVWFHDPLAAVAVFEPGVCEMEGGHATVVLADGDDKGRTLWQKDPRGRQQVATAIDPAQFFQFYFAPFKQGN
jgi:inosine-uridine nucleoside N-ribohydrolase